MKKSVSKVQPNKYSVACNQVSDKKGVEVPFEINDNEKHLYHVLIIDSKANHITQTFEHKVRKQMFNQETFTKNSNDGSYVRLGYGNMVVYHDPTLPEVEEVDEIEEVKTLSVKDLENSIENYSLIELEEMLSKETRKGAIQVITDRIEYLSK